MRPLWLAWERIVAVVQISYPPQLPVSARRDDIAAAIRDHQVVIVAGETGSGKTTQLPKICLELGRGRGPESGGSLIGHTQPRRIAARSVAERIAEELETGLGDLVGYQVRFTDSTSPATRLKVMTDGILLAELQRDRQLRRYDTIIIDEAHERSLNIDFLLGYLKRLLPRRPDLKLIITSATIDPERFAAHFADRHGRPAPIIEVSGRTYPVEVRYRPLIEHLRAMDEEGEAVVRDQTDAIVDAVRELSAEGAGDILVFLPGEREIRDTADVLDGLGLRNPLEVVPLYSRLSAAEQHRVFQPHGGRRVVLATNVAETSLTVPGIRYVVDTGVARISRYSVRTKVQRLPIEPISQASANQRSGRCGRVEAGIAIRLYSEEDFESRPEFTDPEILRTNLASVVLQMTSLGLGDIARFPFVEPPDRRNVTAGVQLLEELGALAGGGTDSTASTRLGKRLARLPVDPRLGRMVLEAERLGCVRDVLVIAAALSLQDPRERPTELQAQADQAHARFRDETSDFLTWLNLWRYLREQQRELSSSAFRRMCKREFLNYLRVREWQSFESQLRQVCREMRIQVGAALGPARRRRHPPGAALRAAQPHRAAGGARQGQARTTGVPRRPRCPVRDLPRQRAAPEEPAVPDGRRAGGDRPALGPPERRDQAGVGRAPRRPPGQAHLLRAALVEEACRRHGPRAGDAVRRPARRRPPRQLRAGRPGREPRAVHPARARPGRVGHTAPVPGDEPRAAGGGRGAGAPGPAPRHRGRRAHPLRLLRRARGRRGRQWRPLRHLVEARAPGAAGPADLRPGDADPRDGGGDPGVRLPPDLAVQPVGRGGEGLTFPIGYHFEPGAEDDGITIDVPVATLNRVSSEDFSWNVPGLREELVTALIRSLPKQLRVNFVPAPNRAREFLAAVPAGDEPLLDALERHLRATTGVVVPRDAWDWSRVPAHLQPTYRIVDDTGAEQAKGKDLDALKEPLRPSFAQAMADVAADSGRSRTGETAWVFGTIEESFTQRRAGHEVRGFPALVDEGRASDSGSSARRRRPPRDTASGPAACCCSVSRSDRAGTSGHSSTR